MVDEMKRHGVDAIVFSSTAAVYGEPDVVPIPEDAPTIPVNPYGASKLAFEEILEDCRIEADIRSIRFRYFNVAGAWPDGSMGEAHDPETHIIPRVLAALRDGQTHFEVFGGDYPTPDGTCVRDYIHVFDLADAHRLGLERLGRGDAGRRVQPRQRQGLQQPGSRAYLRRRSAAETSRSPSALADPGILQRL